jgi:hypothetical protein
MMSTPRIYHWTDDGAPQLTMQTGTLINLLDKCLVTGYGSEGNEKESAGWDKAFEDTVTYKAVYRPPAGLRPFLRIQDNGSFDQGASVASAKAFMQMTDIDTGTVPFCTATANNFWGKGSVTASEFDTPRQWLLAADDKSLALFISRDTTIGVSLSPLWFGEIRARHPQNVHGCYISQTTTANAAIVTKAFSYAVGDLQIGEAGVSASGIGSSIYMPGYTASPAANQMLSGTFTGSRASSDIAPKAVVFDPSYVQVSRYLVSLPAFPRILGVFPGIRFPCHALSREQFPHWTHLGAGLRTVARSTDFSYVLDTDGDWDDVG